jgi:hypothetical protein
VSVECDDFQFVVVMTQIECKKQKNYRKSAVGCHLIYAFHLLKITSQVQFPGMQNRQLYSDRNLTILETLDLDTDDIDRELFHQHGATACTARKSVDCLIALFSGHLSSRFGDRLASFAPN